MGEPETRDYMSVDSFSQLPFIRPSPKPSTSPSSNSAIRLFGIEFPPDSPSKAAAAAADTNTANQSSTTTNTAVAAGGDTGRKFECHYCCRNFPTSQALGGHQNAHKRERQQAKRAHLQSFVAASHAHHHLHGAAGMAEGHMYGILNYHRLGSGSTTPQHNLHAARLGLEPPIGPPPPLYPSWSSGGGGARFYGGLGSVSQPINGNPLPALWRTPNGTMGVVVHQDSRSIALPLFGGDPLESKPVGVVPAAVAIAGSSASHAQDRRGSESGAKDHSVSLDLHL